MNEEPFQRAAVLMGGPSSEREVSLASGRAVAEALRAVGRDALEVDVAGEEVSLPPAVEAVFIALHGRFGEDGGVQRYLNGRRLPYTGSGAEASACAFDKIRTQDALQRAGLPVPRREVLRYASDRTLPVPVIAKPPRQGSSLGVVPVLRESEWPAAFAAAREYDEQVLVEDYIEGREVTVGLLGEQNLPVVEIVPRDFFYDYTAKYTSGCSRYCCPADLPPELTLRLQLMARRAFEVIGCRGMARVDFRVNDCGRPYLLEVNTIPGFTQTSLLPKAAATAGIAFPQLCDRILQSAIVD